MLMGEKVSHIPSPESPPPPPPVLGCGLNPLEIFFFFFFLPGCNWIQAETTTSAPGKEGIGAGAEERLWEKGGTRGESQRGLAIQFAD